MRPLLIYSSYKHHGPDTGYKQIAKLIDNAKKLGVDYNNESNVSKRKLSYLWLTEFEAWKFRNDIDLLHIMYGEEYLRFSPYLFKRIPIIVTFHQPPKKLEEYIKKGSQKGRIDAFTHQITKNRFSKIDAAIVTEENQKDVLKTVMSEEKIHVIPLGIYVDKYINANAAMEQNGVEHKNQILTVGNWLRDWDFFDKVLKHFKDSDKKFILVNRNFSSDQLHHFSKFNNVQVLYDIDDAELRRTYFESRLHFLPLKEAAGNNALLEGFAMGCPTVMSNIVGNNFPFKSQALSLFDKTRVESAVEAINRVFSLSEEDYKALRNEAIKVVDNFDWAEIANRTKEVYKKILNK
ncbi:MAG: glycosyltransferase [Bacteroidetes bacterium]|nr:glycosyltransferase [Bacteroidota bacterium]